jgi:hypothetical protein
MILIGTLLRPYTQYKCHILTDFNLIMLYSQISVFFYHTSDLKLHEILVLVDPINEFKNDA